MHVIQAGVGMLMERHRDERNLHIVHIEELMLAAGGDVIDHVVVASSGIWVIAEVCLEGKVEFREAGSRENTERQLLVDRANRTDLTDPLHWQVEAVRRVIAPVGFGTLPIRPVICFSQGEWGLFGRPFRIHGVNVTWAKKLCEQVCQPGLLDDGTIDCVARRLTSSAVSYRR